MLKFGFLYFAILSLMVSCNQKEKAGETGNAQAARASSTGEGVPASPPVPGKLVLTAKLLEVPGSFPPNELYNYAYIMKYEVVSVLQGEYSEKEMLVGHYNPRISRSDIRDDQDANVGGNLKTFNPGDVHYLVLNDMDGVWTGAIEDEYYKDQSTRYWASWADKN